MLQKNVISRCITTLFLTQVLTLFSLTNNQITHLTRSATNGDAKAQTELGYRYLFGIGVTKNVDQGFTWSRKAADQKNLNAYLTLGLCYEFGQGTPTSKQTATEWYTNYLLSSPDAEQECSICMESLVAYKDLPYQKLLEQDQHNPAVQYELGNRYLRGNSVEKNLAKAFELYLQAAQHNDPQAQFTVGVCYESGLGTAQDTKKAFDWYLKAAKQNYPQALYSVSNCYHRGIGVEANVKKAKHWLTKAKRSKPLPSQQKMLSRGCVNNHIFHTDCLVSWLMSGHKKSCPTCRGNVFMKINIERTDDYFRPIPL